MKERAAAGPGGLGELPGKAPGHCLRLATTLCVLDWSLASRSEAPPRIERAHVQRAVQLVESYFLPMAKRAFGEAAIPAPELHAMTLARWLREQQAKKFNAREARRQIAGKLRARGGDEAGLRRAGRGRPDPAAAITRRHNGTVATRLRGQPSGAGFRCFGVPIVPKVPKVKNSLELSGLQGPEGDAKTCQNMPKCLSRTRRSREPRSIRAFHSPSHGRCLAPCRT